VGSLALFYLVSHSGKSCIAESKAYEVKLWLTNSCESKYLLSNRKKATLNVRTSEQNESHTFRPVQFLVRGSAWTGPVLFGPVFGLWFCSTRSSVQSRVGPVDRIWANFFLFFSRMEAARADRAQKTKGVRSDRAKSLMQVCKAMLLLRRKPVLDRSGPILGPQPTPKFSLRSRPV